VRLAGCVVRILVCVAGGFRDADDGFFVAGVVVEDAVALLDRAKIPLRDRILHAAPHGLLVLYERVVAVILRFFLEEPVHTRLI